MLALPKKYLIALFLLFILSVTIRFVNIGRPLSKHHEFNTAMILNVCNSWDKAGGPHKYNFTPVTYFGNEGDKYYGQHSMIADGKLYYASMGPMQFLLHYYGLKSLGCSFTVKNIELFAIGIHFLLVCLFLQLIMYISKKQQKYTLVIFCSIVTFIFLPNYLWFFSNAFSHESLVLLFYIIFLLAQFQKNKIKQNLLLFLSVFLGVLTDWLMLFIVFVFIVYNMITWFKQKDTQRIYKISIACGAALLALLCIYYCFSKTMGQAAFENMLVEKFLSRTVNNKMESSNMLLIAKAILINLLTSYGSLILFISIASIFVYKKLNLFSFSQSSLLWYMVLPPILYNFCFFEFSTRHDYAMMKYAFLFIGVYAYLLLLLMQYVSRKKLIFITACITVLQLSIYFGVNGAFYFQKKNNYYIEQKIGNYIKEKTNPEQSIFITGNINNYPAIMFYSNRNIHLLNDSQEFIEICENNLIKDALLIKVTSIGQIEMAGQFINFEKIK